MNQFEKKSFIISFLVFFSLQTIFISFINYQNYKTYRYLTIDKISKQFQICSYKLNCKKVNTDFVDKKKGLKLLTLLTFLIFLTLTLSFSCTTAAVHNGIQNNNCICSIRKVNI